MRNINRTRFSRFSPGMKLSPGEIMSLKRANISGLSFVEMIRQRGGKLLVYGNESGGGTYEIGYYCGFAFPDPSMMVLTVDLKNQLDRNGLHRRVYGTEMIRYEVFLYDQNHVHFMATSLKIDLQRKMMRVQPLFLGKYGLLKDENAVFFSPARAAEVTIPGDHLEGFRLALSGARTIACKKALFPVPTPPASDATIALPAKSSAYIAGD